MDEQRERRSRPQGTGSLRRTGILVFLVLAVPFAAFPQARTIRMGWFPLPPHVFASEDGGPPTGPTIALFNEMAARMGREVEWVGPLPAYRLGTYQKTGEMNLDGSILYMKNSVTIHMLYIPSQPYFAAKPSLSVRADNPLVGVRSIEDIKGYRIGFMRTLAGYPPLIAEHRDQVILDELGGEDWVRRNLQKLLAGRLDAVYERNQYTIPYQAVVDGIEDKIRILPFPAEPIGLYFVFHRTSPRGAELLREYEEAVAGWAFDYDALVRAEIERFKTGASKRP